MVRYATSTHDSVEKSGEVYTVGLRHDSERNYWLPEIQIKAHGLTNHIPVLIMISIRVMITAL